MLQWLWVLLITGMAFPMNTPPEIDSSRTPQTVRSQASSCPSEDSTDLAPFRYQLFTAYQTGFDGFEMPCEIKCLGKQECQNNCQQKKGRELLSRELSRLKKKKDLARCPSMEAICLKQCEDQGQACKQACHIQTH